MSRAWDDHRRRRPLGAAEARSVALALSAVLAVCAALVASAPIWVCFVALAVGTGLGPGIGHWCWRRALRRSHRRHSLLVRLGDYRTPKWWDGVA